MNRSFRAPGRGQMGGLRLKDNRDEDLALFREMRRRERERGDHLLQNSDEFDAPLGLPGSSPMFNMPSVAAASALKPGANDFLDSDNDKNDYEWLLTPPGTPLFPSLEMEHHKPVTSQLGTPKARPTPLNSRLSNPQLDPAPRSNLSSSRHTSSSSPGLNTSNTGLRKPSSSGGSRPSTPTKRSTVAKSTLTSTSNRSTLTAPAKPTPNTSKSTPITNSKPSRSSTPTPRTTPSSSKPTTARSSTPTRPTTRSSTPTRPTGPISKPALKPSSNAKPATKIPAPPRSSSPSTRPKTWKPSEMPGFSLNAPPNLRTSINDRPPSATRGRAGPGPPSSRSSSLEPVPNGRIRRQSCSPSRGRPPNRIIHNSGSSVPVSSTSRLHAKANDNVSPILVGTKMVERTVNMRKLVPPKQDSKNSPQGKSTSSPDSSGFGRNLSKKSLDMAIRHMDIRRTVPGNLRPLMTSIPASSMYSVRSGPTARRIISVSDSPLATTSSNASSEFNAREVEDDVSSEKGIRSPPSLHGR